MRNDRKAAVLNDLTRSSKRESELRLHHIDRFLQVRQQSEQLCEPLVIEDFVVQTMEDVSPAKWNLGHTTWFFETVVLQRFLSSYKPYHDRYAFVFNSYYESLGSRVERKCRGHLSRPTVAEVFRYRHHVTEALAELMRRTSDKVLQEMWPYVEIGIHHEKQHQEKMMLLRHCVHWSLKRLK